MKLVHFGAISTGTIILIGVVLVAPSFFRAQYRSSSPVTPVLLVFDVRESGDAKEVSSWCKDLSTFIAEHRVRGAVFVSGKVAQAAPECTSFPPEIDIGSSTYSYSDLTAIGDYAAALDEVQRGKQAVDKAGNLDSKLFRAPYKSTDGDIYSLLERSGIVADFSYDDHYNKYENGLFIRYDAKSYSGSQALAKDPGEGPSVPLIVSYDNSAPVDHISEAVLELKSSLGGGFEFVSASGLAGLDLTIREG